MKISKHDANQILQALADANGNKAEAARALGLPRTTLHDRLKSLVTETDTEEESFSVPDFPTGDMPTDKLIAHMSERFKRRHESHRARKWFPVKINSNAPIGICWFGDPHVDDNGCNWPLLERDIAIVSRTDGMFGANIGDSANNWIGRLMRLYADQDTSKDTARQLVRWLLIESGVDWLLWLFGNHDAWHDEGAFMREVGGHQINMHDWQAQFRLVFPNKREAKIWAAHDFPGNSMWNSLHGPLKAAKMKSDANLYICGHKHNWSIQQEESADRGFVYWLARARGYKYIDHYGEILGHQPQQEGAAVLSIFDPDSPTMSGFVQCFADLEQGADFLTWKRKRAR
jgi:hypothetical protein